MKLNDFLIPLSGLAQGRTAFEIKADKEFFASFDNEEILDAEIVADVVVEKLGQFTGVSCDISGALTMECDRCCEPLLLPVKVRVDLTVKYGGDEQEQTMEEENGREVVRLPETDADLDLAQTVYDYVCLCVPMQKVHPEGRCNPVALKYLEQGIKISGEEEEQRNPFSVLSGMFDNNVKK